MSAAWPVRPAEWLVNLGEPVAAVSCSADSSQWGALGTEGKAAVLDAGTGRVLHQWVAHAGGGFRLAWNPTLNLMATSGVDGTARLWDPATGNLMHECAAGSAWVEQLEWSPDGQYLATAADRILTLWNSAGGAIHVWKNHKSTLAALCWRVDGLKLAVACYGGVEIYDPVTGEAEGSLPWKTSLVSLAWSPDRRWVVAGTQDLSVQIWPHPFLRGEELVMSGYSAKVRELAWHPSGRYLATGGGEQIMVWDCGGNGPAGTIPKILQGHSTRLSILAYQARGHLLASGDADGQLLFWNAKYPSPLNECRLPSAITSLAWSRNDRSALAGSHDGSLALVTISGG